MSRKLALIGFGNVGRALARLLAAPNSSFGFQIAGIHTARHGTAIFRETDKVPFDQWAANWPGEMPLLGPPAPSVAAFLECARADIAVELTPLEPSTGEPAIGHIRAAFARGMHAVTANKGPIAHAYAALRDEARLAGVRFRFESTVMDGAPVFNMVRRNLPGVRILGFTGVLNSTAKIVVETMRDGGSMEEGIRKARRLGVAEADASFDIDGWDSAAKAAALANVLMDAGVTPLSVNTRGIGRLTPERVQDLAARGKTVCLVSRGRHTREGIHLRVRPEVVEISDILACVHGTSNLLLLHTDLMGTVGTVSISPTVDQTAYGVLSDLADLAI
jgi:homoserine dehydrogenase